jgi:hypothetical protein
MANDKKKHIAKANKERNENKALKAAGEKPAASKKIVLTRAQSAKAKENK